MGLNLARALRFGSTRSLAFVGAGGKTTAMFQLARELKPPVIVTTTTHLGAWQVKLADQHVIASRPADLQNLEFTGVQAITGPLADADRLQGMPADSLLWLREKAGRAGIPILIEADGARQKPLKAPGTHEPVIPDWIDILVVTAGLSGLGRPLTAESVQRPEIFAQLSGLGIGELISPEALARVLLDPSGGRKNLPPTARPAVLLTQADTAKAQSRGGQLAGHLLSNFDSVIVASPGQRKTWAVHEPIAAIILAAGESKRFGQPKQLLDWRGEPFVRAVARTALEAGLATFVVTGANATPVEAALQGLPVRIVRNESWRDGQSSSIRAGIGALPARIAAAVFLLADQPQVGTAVIRALVAAHSLTLHPIVAPLVREEKRANPVLFDRDAFGDLLTLEGDVGGRAIFGRYPIEYLPWHDEGLTLDVDGPADYQRLKELE